MRDAVRLPGPRLQLLLSHGLSDSEARVYLTLLEHPAMTAGALAKTAHVPRSHLYKVLHDLHARGLVDLLVEERTRSYRAKPFAEFLQRETEQLRGRLRDMEENLRTVAPVLEPPPMDAPRDPEAGETRVILGRRSVAREVDGLLERAQRHVAFACSDGGWPRALKHLAPFADAWRARGEDAPEVEVFLPLSARAGEWDRLLELPRVRVGWFAAPRSMVMVAVDGEEVLCVHPIPDSPDPRAGRDSAIYARDRVFASNLTDLLRGACLREPARGPP